MDEFGIYLLVGALILFFILIKSRFDKIDGNLSVLNKKLDQLNKTGIPTIAAVAPPKVVEEYKPAIPIIPNIPIIPIVDKTEEVKPAEPKIVPPAIIPINKEEIEDKKPVEKVAFSADAAAAPRVVQERKPYVPEASFWEKFKENNPDLEKFIGENLINKLGILILVLGIGYFVSYSIDKGWIPTPARVGIGILAGAMVLGVAHKLRKLYAAFSSVFVAGAIAIFYFTIAIAFHEYKLFGQEVAFVIMVLITAFAALITVSYDRLELAILTLIGGFAVPFMVSTGSGNYLVLFSYILILNTGILAIAYNKKWHVMNILAFVFTSILFLGWYNKEQYAVEKHYLGGLIFAFAFYLLFMVINIINNIRNKGEVSKIQMALLAANTFVFYGFGIWILQDYMPNLKGLFTTFVGFMNLVYAYFLYKKFGIDKNAIYLLIGLTLTFITLAVPIQFSGHYITLFWAGEAVLLLWLSKKSGVESYKFGPIIVHSLMFVSLIMDWNKFYSSNELLSIVINPIFITGLFAIASCFAVYYLLKNETESIYKFGFTFNPINYRKFIFVVGIVVSYFVGMLEVAYQAATYYPVSPAITAIPAVYHFIFTAILSTILLKKDFELGNQAVNLLACANIILFTFVFTQLSFDENYNHVSAANPENIVYYLHFILLTLTIYFGYLLYKMNKEDQLSDILKKPIFIWVAAFFIIYISSNELMIQGLKINDAPITTIEVVKKYPESANDKYAITNDKTYMAGDKISATKETIVKTSFPILWGVFAFIFLIFGIKKPSKTMRIIALSLLGLTIVKLFAYDISNVSETGKIIAFILLGVLILIISFVYQKLKVLVSDDKNPMPTTIETPKSDNLENENKDENI